MAGFGLDVRADIKDVTRYLRGVQRTAVPKATARALNRTATTTRGAIVKHIAQATSTKPQKLIGAVIKVSVKARKSFLYAEIRAYRRSHGDTLNVINYLTKSKRKVGAFRKKPGVIATIYGKKRTYKGTFIGFSPTENRLLVYARTGKGRDNLKRIHGPVVPNEFLRDASVKVMRTKAAELFMKNFKSDLRFYLSKIR